MPRFSEVANTPIDDIKPPKPIPVGDYLFLIDGPPEFNEGVSERTNEPWESYTAVCRPVQPMETVSQEALRDALEGAKLQERPIRLSFFQPHHLKPFLEACGCRGKTMPEQIAQLAGKQFKAHVVHRPGTRNKMELYANIEQGTYAKA